MQQGSEIWLSWRAGKLTSVDASTLMKGSPSALLKLWEEKLGLSVRESFETPAMTRGKEMEPFAREWFSEYIGKPIWPDCRECKEYPFLASSLDGISLCDTIVYEAKCPTSRKILDQALSGSIDDAHYCQCQHHALVTGVDKVYYHIYFSDMDSHVFEILADKAWQEEYITKAEALWECVQKKIPPIPERTDDKFTFFENELVSILERESILKSQLKDLEKTKKEIYDSLSFLTEGFSAMGKKILFRKQKRKGLIDYNAIAGLQELDLEKYRKEDIIYWQASLRSYE